jgi:hypothetical protein
MGAVFSSETLIITYRTARVHNPKDHSMNLHRWGNRTSALDWQRIAATVEVTERQTLELDLGYVLYSLQIPGFILKVKGSPSFTFKLQPCQ